MERHKNKLAMLILFCCVLCNMQFVYAVPPEAEPTVSLEVDKETTIPVNARIEPITFSVTVPTQLPIVVSANNVKSESVNATISNNSIIPVEIKSVDIDAANAGWTLKTYSDFEKENAFRTVQPNQKNVAFQFDQVKTIEGGTTTEITVLEKQINGKSSRNYDYSAIVSPQTELLQEQLIANVVITVGWI